MNGLVTNIKKDTLKNGGVGVIPTDTLYGLVGSALKPETVERISHIKNRTDGKGFIVLISSLEDLNIFGIELTERVKILLTKFWPGKVSIILDCKNLNFNYLMKDNSIAFRLTNKPDLIEILKQTGPLVAPSANPEGQPPAKNIEEAKKYFALPADEEGDQPDFYEDGGILDSAPSTLIRIVGDKIEVLREGAVKI